MQKKLLKIAKISLVLIYVVIIAGAVVRMTGSGMGCPDWPKCFGYYIPPTDVTQLQWQENRSFKKGQIIIRNEALWVAQTNFNTTETFNPKMWKPYKAHDYAVFNVWHTWIEYINRLATVLLGIPILLLTAVSFWLYRRKPWLTYLSILVLFTLGFQAWLGKTVVDSNLLPLKITMHMIVAFVLVALLLFIIFKAQNTTERSIQYHKPTLQLLIIALTVTTVQIILGTQVRQFIDEQTILFGEHQPHLWLENPTILFYIHRTFSIAIVALNLYIGYRIYQLSLGLHKINWVIALLGLEIITGIAMNYFDFPFASQPLHLLWASLLFGVQFYLVLEASKTSLRPKSL